MAAMGPTESVVDQPLSTFVQGVTALEQCGLVQTFGRALRFVAG